MISREEALLLLKQNNITPALLKHALASEAVLRAMAQRLGEDETLWALTGLLHDLDYPQTENSADQHGLIGAQILSNSLPEEALTAIKSHNGEMNGVVPTTRFDYALRSGESVTGLIAAAALLRPTGYDGMTVKGIKKKMKDKAFAANVNRDNIKECEMAGIPLDEFLTIAINAMSELAN